jgi:hypothetical protein
MSRQSIWSTKALKDSKLTGKDGTCNTEDNLILGVQLTVPTPVIGWAVPSAV